ncbi:hypothetical protein BJF90_07820 [Pseudonocardia sp. CNS-004]|nr:hypothetical protein BJF90_07820 [Pseudonocardia sp. CNS-004]
MARPATLDDKINIAAAVLTVAVAAVFWSQRSYTTEYGGTFADPVIIVLGALGLVLLVFGLLRRPVGRGTEVEEGLPVRGLVLAVALLTAWVAALPYLGYLVGGSSSSSSWRCSCARSGRPRAASSSTSSSRSSSSPPST